MLKKYLYKLLSKINKRKHQKFIIWVNVINSWIMNHRVWYDQKWITPIDQNLSNFSLPLSFYC